MDTSLGYRDSLLLHGFVDGDLILDVHLVKLIDAANTVVGEHQCTRLDAKLARFRVLPHRGCQPGRIRRLTATVDCPWQELTDVLEELRFCGGWVSHDADIDVASELDLVRCDLLDPAEELQKDALLDVKVPIDSGSDRV